MSRAALGALVLSLIGSAAQATRPCKPVSACCSWEGEGELPSDEVAWGHVVLEARITEVRGARAFVEVTAVHRVLDGGVPDVSRMPREPADEAGRQVLIFATSAGDVSHRLNIDETGQVACGDTFRLPAEEVVQAALTSDCLQTLQARGLSRTCSSPGILACGASPLESAAFLAVLLAGLRWRPRRRAAVLATRR